MAKVFRLYEKGIDDKSHWFASKEIKQAQIEEIKDPTGDSSSRAITSIPSPFARMDLFRTAFEYVGNLSDKDLILLDGKTIYHKLISECFDVGEMFFNFDRIKSEETKILCWDVQNNIRDLSVSTDYKHQRLGKTLKLYSEQDKKVYNFDITDKIFLISHNYSIIGGTSPLTLFVSSPNDVSRYSFQFGANKLFVKDKYFPLYERDIEFQKFIYFLFYLIDSENGMKTRLPQFEKYLTNNLKLLDHKNNALYQAINSYIQEGPAKKKEKYFDLFGEFNIEDKANNPIELFAIPIRKQKYAIAKSDFEIVSQKYNEKHGKSDKKNFKMPLVLQRDFRKTGFEYFMGIWDIEIKVPYKSSVDDFNKRILPNRNIIYPYLTVNDFLHEYLIQLPYPINKNRFFDGNLANNTSDLKGFLIPLKQLYFEFFTIDDLKDSLKITKNREDVLVTLKIPIQNGEFIVFERSYKYISDINTSKPNINEDNNDGMILENYFGVTIFPAFRLKTVQDNFYRILWIDTDGTYFKYKQEFYTDKNTNLFKDTEKQKYVKQHSDEDALVTSKFFVLENKIFDYIEIENSYSKGLIVPNFLKPNPGTKEFIFSVDFGTTYTHIEYKIKEGDDKRPTPMSITESDIYATFHDPKIESIDVAPEVTDLIKHLLFPPIISENADFSYPHRSVLGEFKNMDFNKESFGLADNNILFTYEKYFIKGSTIPVTNLKWTNYTLQDEEGKKEIARINGYFEAILLLIRSKAILNGGNLSNLKLFWFYPTSMLPPRKEALKKRWEENFKKYISKKTDTNLREIPESLPPFYYYKTKRKISSVERPAISIDIGGETVDIVIFDKKTIDCITSFRFGANTLFGDGYYNSKEENGFLLKFSNPIKSILEEYNIKELISAYESIEHRESKDLIAFFFSLENNRYLKHQGINISLSQMLVQDSNFKIVFLLYYAAIIFHIGKLIKNKKNLDFPKYITFSGNGSKIINYIDESNDKLRLVKFTEMMLGKVLGRKETLEILLEDNPKVITAKGVLEYGEIPSNIEDLQTIWPGFDLSDLDEDIKEKESIRKKDDTSLDPSKLTYEKVQKDVYINAVLKEVNEFLTSFFTINSEFDFHKNFTIKPSIITEAKNSLNTNLIEYLGLGIEEKLKELEGDFGAKIEETMFFYPIIGALDRLTSKIGNM